MGMGRTTLGPTRWLCHVGVAQARRRGTFSRSGAEDLSLQPPGRDSSALGNTLHWWVWGLHGRIVFLTVHSLWDTDQELLPSSLQGPWQHQCGPQ